MIDFGGAMNIAIRTMLVIALPLLTMAASAKTTKHDEGVQGTVNIFLANGNGLVAITDSRLSDESGSAAGFGQKLFKVDDQTVCSIAGFFSWSGPVFPGNKTKLLPTAVPAVLNAYIDALHSSPPESLQSKFEDIAKAWDFDLNIMLEFGAIAKQPYVPSEASVITIGGYENGVLWIGQVSLVPTNVNGVTTFVLQPANPVLQKVGDALGYATAGFDSEVVSILDKPESTSDRDPIFAKYSRSKAADNGASLRISDLETLAKKLETIAATKHSREVGGDQQVAVLTNGKVSAFDSPPSSSPDSLGQETVTVQISHDNQFHGGGEVMGPLPPKRVGFFFNDYFSKAVVQLDDRVEIYSTFSDCTLFYDGSPLVLFDTNQLINTDLQLGPKASLDSPIVKDFQRKYPTVHVTPWPNGFVQKTHSGITIRLQTQ
jgi:hypothetical protein